MNYRKKFLAVLLLFSILISSFRQDGIPLDAASISKEAEWNLKCLNAQKSYEESRYLPKIRVAVLDSGLDTDRHIPFVKRKDFLGEEELHSMFQDETGHGTSVAGLICADENDERITGIAANVELYVGRILDAKNEAPVERVIEAVEWAMAEKVNIIHMSFGTKYYSEELEEVIKRAYQQGILIIAAAGNDGNAAEDESTIEYPAAFDEVISVGATDTDNSVLDSSSTGEELDVVAPGSQVLSIGAFGGVVVDDGTSISAAHVTGIAAVLWGKHPDKSNEFIKNLLVASANSETVRGDCGNGLVDYSQSNVNYKHMNQIYEALKKKGYTEKTAATKAAQNLPHNTKPVASYENEVNYVNGLWSRDKHESLAQSSIDALNGDENNKNSIVEDDIALVKAGARLPDELEQMKTMSAHPCFHGDGNYFANVSYLLAYAKQLVNEQGEKLPEFKSFLKNEKMFNENFSDKRYNIQTELGNCQNIFYEECAKRIQAKDNILSTKQKGYAILGAALHSITDTFAHMAYRKDLSYTQKFCEIIHNRVGQRGWEDSVTQLWHDIANSNNCNKDDKDYYTYMLDTFACADNVDKMKCFSILSQKVSNELIASLYGSEDFLDKMKDILLNYKNVKVEGANNIEKPENYRLANVNTNWAAVKDDTKFEINLDVGELKIDCPKKKDITAKIKAKKMIITFPHKAGYYYQIYFFNKKNEKIFLKRNGNKYTINRKEMNGNKVYIVSFLESHQNKTVFSIEYKITYYYKKKKKTQIVPFEPKKLKFPLRGNIFKLKKKKFKGWSKKKTAKKATYKPKQKISFTGNGKMKLYCVKK